MKNILQLAEIEQKVFQSRVALYYQIAGITMQISSDLPLTDKTFHSKFKLFRVKEPGTDIIKVHHKFGYPELQGDLGTLFYHKTPWKIFQNGDFWIYRGFFSFDPDSTGHQFAIFNSDHTSGIILNPSDESFIRGGRGSLTFVPTDQILLARVLADRKSLYIHSSGLVINEKGFLFVGRSGAGKSTITKILGKKARILCDDRIIIRDFPEGIQIYGTWSHGDIHQISPDSAPLHSILFLEKSNTSGLTRINNNQEITTKLIENLIKPFVTIDWWDKVLKTVSRITAEIPCYIFRVNPNEDIIKLIEPFSM